MSFGYSVGDFVFTAQLAASISEQLKEYRKAIRSKDGTDNIESLIMEVSRYQLISRQILGIFQLKDNLLDPKITLEVTADSVLIYQDIEKFLESILPRKLKGDIMLKGRMAFEGPKRQRTLADLSRRLRGLNENLSILVSFSQVNAIIQVSSQGGSHPETTTTYKVFANSPL
jgi:hypothetical protein